MLNHPIATDMMLDLRNVAGIPPDAEGLRYLQGSVCTALRAVLLASDAGLMRNNDLMATVILVDLLEATLPEKD